MIVLDTNVVSESMRPQPEPKVSAWLDAQPAQMLFLTSITVAELLAGIAVLPQGKRKADLEDETNRNVDPGLYRQGAFLRSILG